MRAIEDAGPADGVLVRPSGPPVVLGPENWNAAWSEAARDEAVLRAIRPADLRQESPELLPVGGPQTSPPRDGPETMRAFIQGLVAENARLWSERDSWRGACATGNWVRGAVNLHGR